MAVKFKKYTSTQADLTLLGTVNETVGIGGSYKLSSRRNLMDVSKRVTLVLLNKKGESDIVVCSKPLSQMVRNKQITMSEIGALQISEQELTNPVTGEKETGNVVVLPGDGTDETKVTVTAQSVKQSAKTISLADLVAF